MQQRRVVFVIFEGFQSLDLSGPFEVFQQAGRPGPGYDCRVVAPVAGPVRSSGGLRVHADHGIADLDSAGIDMALWLVGRLHGRDHARAVRRYIQYEPAPPYLADEPVAY